MTDMVVDQVKKAEILYEYGSMKDFLKDFFAGTTVDFIYLETQFIINKSEVEPHTIRENWDDWENSEDDFLSEGYTRNDILYEDELEATLAIREESIEKVACELTKSYFHDNQEMIPYLVEYIEAELS